MFVKAYHHNGITIEQHLTGAIQENCYLVHQNGKGYIVDPGDDAEELIARVQFVPLAILLTHAHFDHVGAVEALRDHYQIEVYLHPEDLPLLHNAKNSAKRWNIDITQPRDPEQTLSHGQELTTPDFKLTVRHVPGHAPGHVVFVGEGFVLAGDTLFQNSIGRTDLPFGNHPLLIQSIHTELLTLPDQTAVYSGHGSPTTVGHEKRNNPYLR